MFAEQTKKIVGNVSDKLGFKDLVVIACEQPSIGPNVDASYRIRIREECYSPIFIAQADK